MGQCNSLGVLFPHSLTRGGLKQCDWQLGRKSDLMLRICQAVRTTPHLPRFKLNCKSEMQSLDIDGQLGLGHGGLLDLFSPPQWSWLLGCQKETPRLEESLYVESSGNVGVSRQNLEMYGVSTLEYVLINMAEYL